MLLAEAAVLINSILSEFLAAIFNGYLFWVVLAIVALQYRKIAKNREVFIGPGGNTVIRDTVIAAGFGIAGGLAATFLLIITGVNLTSLGIVYLWILALLLMLINPRFLCFSYSGGIVALSHLLFGFPEVDVPQLMGLIAVLHLVESLLIYFSGHAGATPMFTKRPDGRLVGGFTLQKFWPLPVVAVAVLSYPEAMDYSALPSMPDWWPAIKFGGHSDINSIGVLFPFIVGLGYGDIALANTPAEKSRMSARNLSIFSLILLGLAILASRYPYIQVIAALFSPLGHEAVIYLGQKTEMKGKPLYTTPTEGVMVLEAVPDTPAGKGGLASGDIIYSVNGIKVNSKHDINAVLLTNPGNLEVEYLSRRDNKWRRVNFTIRFNQSLGIITVPEGDESVYTEYKNRSLLKKFLRKLGVLPKN